MSFPSDPADTASKGEDAGPDPVRAEQKADLPVAPEHPEHKVDRPASVRPGGPNSLIGLTLSGRYLIERLIGEGGMGAVYQAEHTHMHKRLAVKVLHPEMSRMPEVVARFEREAMAAAHIDHPNVAAATDFGKLDDGSFFLVLEYVEGRSLRDAVSDGRFELGRAIHVVRQIASALGRAHALGIVHRDLKPENVMLVSREGDTDFVKVLDFGIAKVPIGAFVGESTKAGQVLTQLGMVYGTPEYMAPEQALGQEVDARADLYALGAIMFEMIAGVRPYEHESKVTLLGMHVTAPIPRLSERAPDANVPAVVETVVTRLLAKEAGARFPDSKHLVEVLDQAVDELTVAGRLAAPPPSTARGGAGSTPLRKSHADLPPSSVLALGPTSLAQPPAARGGFASLVGATLAKALQSAPPWMTPRRVVVAAAALSSLVLVLVVVAATRGGSAAAGSITSASGLRTETPRLPDPETDDVVSTARTKVDKGDFASAIDSLLGVERTAPDRPEVHQLLERAYAGVRNTHDALHQAGLWLVADPVAGASDPKLQEDVRNAALVRETQDDAFALLESKMGTRGIDILYDIAFGASGRPYPQAAMRARRSLDVEDIRGRASPALDVLLDFREAKACDAKRVLLDRAREHGDARMIVILQPYVEKRGCGFLGRSDCYPCMHRDSALLDAISAIEERSR